MRFPCLRLQNVYRAPAEGVREGGIQVSEMVTGMIE